MAPSLRNPAPAISTTTRSTGKSRQSSKKTAVLEPLVPVNGNLGRVTKSRLGQRAGSVKVLDAVKADVGSSVDEKSVAKAPPGRCEPVASVSLTLGSKRKRDESESVDEGEDAGRSSKEEGAAILSKKRRFHGHVQLLSPPASRDGTDCDEAIPSNQARLTLSPRSRRVNAVLPPVVELPQSLLDLISMHAAFLKALSLHYAHNGSSTPAELGSLMDSITRLWKKQSVRIDAVQRMLGLYEMAADPTPINTNQVVQKCCPFRIVTSGLGLNVRTNLEYVGQALFNEATLQTTFSDMVRNCFKNNDGIHDSTRIPLLAIALGTQTSLHRAKAASTRAEILSLSASAQSRSAPDFSKLSITEPSDHTPAAVKSRTLSLFDRVRAKGLASANNTPQTAEQITRQHAMGRINEVVEFLRMKQQQKLSSQFQSSVHDSPGKTRTAGKVSFSLGAIVRDIRQSVGVPIGEEEVRVCLRILSQEVPGDWCRIIELGTVVSITLQGRGLSGLEVRRMLEKTVSRI